MGPSARVALVTCAGFPDLWEDDHPLRDALRERGVVVDAVRWDDPAADWSVYDLTVIRSPWDYMNHHERFLSWARSVPRLANPADIVEWNTDKRYLSELAAAGIPIIPTEFVGPDAVGSRAAGPASLGSIAGDSAAVGSGAAGSGALGSGALGSGALGSGALGSGALGSGALGSGALGSGALGSGALGSGALGSGALGSGALGSGALGSGALGSGAAWTPPAAGEWVVKPTVSAGSRDTARYLMPEQSGAAAAHVRRLTGSGRTAMIQPYLSAVDTAGETAVLCTPDADGELTFSHGIRKGPMLTARGDVPVDMNDEQITPRTPSEAELDLAARVLEFVPGGAKRLLYARVDLIPGPDGAPMLIELELTEPSLFLLHAPGAASRLADAILSRI
ncbi:hypothetical protein CLV67_103698 [Actinoplanes italicus]|uniref:ATP-grasp domain-containing protein n=2 Tax=Actinoplanes italicus TaxID=113567 RepID=A0A2T0KKA6_9ACTN|nr:hypothetical protein CLV67_103698 [Actinoplanes italicus]